MGTWRYRQARQGGSMKALIILGLCALLSGCIPSSIRNSVVDVRASLGKSSADQAYKSVTMALVNQGFDLKMRDAELRLITTEYKKYTSVSGWPPFDFYLQVKATVRDLPQTNDAEITLWPKVKEQNRLNQNAFTEHALIVYSPTETADTFTMTVRSDAMRKAQVLFESIIQSIAEASGLPAASFKITTQSLEVQGM